MDVDSVPATMRRVVVTADGPEIIETPVPIPVDGEVLVRTAVAGICGSDLHAWHGRHPFVTLPYAAGHEVAGTVVAGAAEPGSRVVVEPPLPCWECKQCTAGRPNICERLRFFGCAY